jgi:excisionase family DNA binding protein
MSDLTFALPGDLVERLVDQITERVVERATEHLRRKEAEPYMDSKQAGVYLACKRQRIHELVHQGRLEPRRDGNRLLFRRSQLDAYLENQA